MRKKNTTIAIPLLRFPDQQERRAREIKRDAADLYDPIPHERIVLLAEILRDGLGADRLSVEALLALIFAVADPEGNEEKFQTAKTALMLLALPNADRIDSTYTRQVLLDQGIER